MHIRSTIYIDPDVWRQLQAEARERRVSASWLTEEVLREFLACEKLDQPKKARKPRAPKLEAIIDRSA